MKIKPLTDKQIQEGIDEIKRRDKADSNIDCASLSGSRLAELANEWERKGWTLNKMANDIPEDRKRLWAKAGVFRSVAEELRRAIKDENRENTH